MIARVNRASRQPANSENGGNGGGSVLPGEVIHCRNRVSAAFYYQLGGGPVLSRKPAKLYVALAVALRCARQIFGRIVALMSVCVMALRNESKPIDK